MLDRGASVSDLVRHGVMRSNQAVLVLTPVTKDKITSQRSWGFAIVIMTIASPLNIANAPSGIYPSPSNTLERERRIMPRTETSPGRSLPETPEPGPQQGGAGLS